MSTTVNGHDLEVTVPINSENCEFDGHLVCELDLSVPPFRRVNLTAVVRVFFFFWKGFFSRALVRFTVL